MRAAHLPLGHPQAALARASQGLLGVGEHAVRAHLPVGLRLAPQVQQHLHAAPLAALRQPVREALVRETTLL